MTFRRAALGLCIAALVPMAVGAAPADDIAAGAAGTPLPLGEVTTAAQLPDDVLAQLPTNAADVGLDYAPRLVTVTTATQDDRSTVADSGLDVTEHAGHDYVEVVLNSAEEEALLGELGYPYEVVIPDLIAREHERILADAAYFRMTAAAPIPSGRTTYRVLGDFAAEIDQLVADNPDIAKRISLGESVEGRDLTGIEIGVGVNDPEDGRPVFLMFGAHHAREWPSAEAPMEFAHELIQDWNAGDARARDLLTRTRAIIVPVSNPDGFDASRTSGDLIDLNPVDGGGTVAILGTPGNAYKRKNCRIVNGQTQPAGTCLAFPSPGGFGIGIDLNRNYGALWGGPGADGDTPREEEDGSLGTGMVSPVYHGPAPFSEPETQAIRTLISTRQVTTVITNHTFSNLLLRPVGVEPSTTHPDGSPVGFAPDECFTTPDGHDNGMQALGERMTAQTGYSNQFGWELYDTTGTTEDYSYNATGGYGYTFEIGPDEFHPPFEEWVSEYTGETAAAEAVTRDNYRGRTTLAGRDCQGEVIPPDTVGGGLREAFYLSLENAADTATHSLLSGRAPAGAEIGVSRTGTFPLWDGTPVEDTVATTMTVAGDGEFIYHVNPSTRPFAASRPFTEGETPEPVIEETSSETVAGGPTLPPATGTEDVPIEVPAGTDAVVVEMTATVPVDDYDLQLLSPDLVVLDESASGSSEERVEFVQPNGVQPGEYVARVVNFSAVGDWELTITLGTVPDVDTSEAELQFTAGSTEEWTVTCSLDGEEVARRQVVVDRGDSKDLGTFCAAAAGPVQPAPGSGSGSGPTLPATGGGLVLGALLAVAAGMQLRRRA